MVTKLRLEWKIETYNDNYNSYDSTNNGRI